MTCASLSSVDSEEFTLEGEVLRIVLRGLLFSVWWVLLEQICLVVLLLVSGRGIRVYN